MDSYSEKTYHHIIDHRTPQERMKQHLLVEELVIRNLKTFGITMTDKKKIQYKPREKLRVDLGQGWYCNISDSGTRQKHTILTLHGAPGDHVQWAALQKQMGGSVRWVNLTIPGFDGEDERRGNYNGSADHFCKLIEKLMKVLLIPKIILCGHSLGSIFGTYFITKNPHLVEGYINITGIVDHWYTGLLTFFQTVITQNGYNSPEWRQKRLFDDDHERIILHHKFLQTAEGRSFGPVEFPKLTITEMFGYMRLINSFPSGLSEIYGLNEKLQIFRVLIFGKKDPLHEHHKTQASIANLCWGKTSYLNLSKYRKLFSSSKSRIEERLRRQFNITVNGQKIQQYFCYHLQDTGHNAHKRRPIELSRIFKIYIACIQQLTDMQGLSLSKL